MAGFCNEFQGFVAGMGFIGFSDKKTEKKLPFPVSSDNYRHPFVRCGSLAQLVEQLTLNQRVASSILARSTIFKILSYPILKLELLNRIKGDLVILASGLVE